MSNKYSFQEDAVAALATDFKKNKAGRFILVIPTGGGKTLTAMKAVLKLAQDGTLPKGKKVLWIVHRVALLQQTLKYREHSAPEIMGCGKELSDLIEVRMKSAGVEEISNKDKWGLIIIDEAHHAAAGGYQNLFEYGLPILGLTATPTRHDGQDLPFDKVSYSITFAELVRRGVIVPPKFHRIDTGETIFVSGLSTDDDSEGFNTETRNQFIAEQIIKRENLLKKVVIFAGTRKHVEQLYAAVNRSNELHGKPFQHIGFIHGTGNEQVVDNEEYLTKHKKLDSSILVNCQILTEGYDDPKINGIVMACPTDSISHYMQCIGRAVRASDSKGADFAHVLEFVDRLPNVQYRIDNRWLYAEISDFLEPDVHDLSFASLDEFRTGVEVLRTKHRVPASQLAEAIALADFDDLSILFFSGAEPHTDYPWGALVFSKENREERLRVFNHISDNVDAISGINPDYVLSQIGIKPDHPVFGNNVIKTDLFEACKLARKETLNKQKCVRLQYYTFRKSSKLPDGLLEFIDSCWNKEDLLDSFENLDRKETVALLKFPLPLGGAEGYWANTSEVMFSENYINILKGLVLKYPPQDREGYYRQAESELRSMPLPIRYLRCYSILARENFPEHVFKI